MAVRRAKTEWNFVFVPFLLDCRRVSKRADSTEHRAEAKSSPNKVASRNATEVNRFLRRQCPSNQHRPDPLPLRLPSVLTPSAFGVRSPRQYFASALPLTSVRLGAESVSRGEEWSGPSQLGNT